MKVGSLVECIRTLDASVDEHFKPVSNDRTFPVKGNIYVVSGVDIPMKGFITLEEFPGKVAHWTRAFREVQPPIEITIDKIISEQQPV